MERAWEIFHKLGMDKTELRNGILFYLAIEEHRFAVIGDEGIHKKVGTEFWVNLSRLMEEYFQRKKFAQGLSESIHMAGEQLAIHFPRLTSDQNELPDHISE